MCAASAPNTSAPPTEHHDIFSFILHTLWPRPLLDQVLLEASAAATPGRSSTSRKSQDVLLTMVLAPRLFRSRRRHVQEKNDEKPALLRTNTQLARRTQHVRKHWWGLRTFLTSSSLLWLLIFVPLGIVGGHNGWSSTFVFTTSMLGILPLAMLLSNATEELAAVAGEVVGALLNATFGNAVEMIVSTVALTRGEIKIVQSSMLGAVLSNILLCLGTCLFIGGYKHDCQFNATAASTMASLMVVASSSLIVPAALNLAFPSMSLPGETAIAGSATSHSMPSILVLSRGTSIILLVLYLIYLHFQLKSHTHLFCESQEEPETPIDTGDASPEPSSPETAPVTLQPPMAIGVLAIISVLIAMCAENLVNTLDDVVSSLHINKTFIGLIILPIVGNAAEYVSAFRASARGKMSLALGVAVGSSMQIALFVTPALVILGWLLGQPMSLSFEPFGAIVFYLSVIVVEGVISDGDSNYLEGAMLVGVYMIVALGFFVFPTE